MTDPIRTLCDLPDGAMPLEVMEVCGYLDHEGVRRWAFRHEGDYPVSTAVGLLRLAEHKILGWADQRNQI